MPDVLTLGETLGCLRSSGPVRLGGPVTLGVVGAESNVAIGLSRLGHTAAWAGVVGPDEIGELIVRTLRAEGVDVTRVRRAEAPTGIVVFEERLTGVTRVDYHRRHSAGSTVSEVDVAGAFIPAPRIVHLTGLTMALSPTAAAAVCTAARLGKEHGALVCLDVNYRSRLWTSEQAQAALADTVGFLDVVVASDDELGLIAPTGHDVESWAAALLDCGVRTVVVKHGAAGATSYSAGGTLVSPAKKVTAVDAIGAGDAFVSGYLSGVLDGLTEADRLDRANTVGAFAVATRGDWEGLPTKAELALLTLPTGEVVR
ncbi:sugar kinase [Aeromicrobium sp. P5_D10]